MISNPAVKRPYRSDVREERARARRLAVISAASRLFAEHGYAATSVDAIAKAADVARATVFNAVGGKPALIRAAYRVAVLGDDEPIAATERPWAKQVYEARTQSDVLDAYARVLLDVFRRVARVYDALRVAAGVEPELIDFMREVEESRLSGARAIVDELLLRGGLRPDVSPEMAADILCIFNDPALYSRMVLHRDWDEPAFNAWLAFAMRTQVLPQPGYRSPSSPST
ncbi:TetR/AcrR family transcriptional regulator [Dactylosporangium sp. CA-092794]|uniref:TetR/AcrR family transcriptional regulator n=1 Tax=Dactylosporangium sp. CA-092794 TaxID=3239929 RepID=UPI003D8FE59E